MISRLDFHFFRSILVNARESMGKKARRTKKNPTETPPRPIIYYAQCPSAMEPMFSKVLAKLNFSVDPQMAGPAQLQMQLRLQSRQAPDASSTGKIPYVVPRPNRPASHADQIPY